jgi:hypothetical protein
MIPDLLKALLGIGVILGAWILVQRSFRRSAGLSADADPLGGHFRCHGCKCEGTCENRTTHDSQPSTR